MTDSDKIDKCLSRVVSPVHRVDRFYDICLFIREEMRKRLPQCLTTTISGAKGRFNRVLLFVLNVCSSFCNQYIQNSKNMLTTM